MRVHSVVSSYTRPERRAGGMRGKNVRAERTDPRGQKAMANLMDQNSPHRRQHKYWPGKLRRHSLGEVLEYARRLWRIS